MKLKLVFIGLVCLTATVLSCTDNIAEDVYHMETVSPGERTSSLVIEVLNADGLTGLLVGATDESLFDEQGVGRTVSEGDLLLNTPLDGNSVSFGDMMDWYGSVLFFNVFSKTEGGDLQLLTHHGNELEYQVVAGDITKSVDLDAVVPDVIRKTVITVSVDQSYSDKTLYFTDDAKNEKFRQSLDDGGEVPEDLYLGSGVPEGGSIGFTIDSPASEGEYHFYLIAPEEGVPYLQRTATIDYDTPEVSVSFEKEQPKLITITAVYLEGTEEPYTETPLHNKEVYLIPADGWPAVKEHVEKDKGNPEPGSYVARTVLDNGAASFGVFCTEGEQDYVVYVPKWNTDYYDSYESREVTVNASQQEYPVDIRALFTPPGSGGDVGITKSVTFTVKIDAMPSGFAMITAPAYIIADSEYLSATWNHVMGGPAPEIPVYKSQDLAYTPMPISVQVEDVEINTAKEIVVFVPGMTTSFVPAAILKRIRGSEITGNTCEVTLDTIEYIN